MSISEALVAAFQEEAKSTRRVLEAVPEDRLGWKPHEKSMTLGRLASHVADTPSWVLSMMEPELDLSAMPSGYKPFAATGSADLLAAFDKNAKSFADTLAGKSDAFMQEPWTMRHGDNVIMTSPRHAAIHSITIHHVIHHRGQLTVYLRLLEVPVPRTFGPTADSPSF